MTRPLSLPSPATPPATLPRDPQRAGWRHDPLATDVLGAPVGHPQGVGHEVVDDLGGARMTSQPDHPRAGGHIVGTLNRPSSGRGVLDRSSGDSADPYEASIENVARAATALHAAVERAVSALEGARRERALGVDLVPIIEHLRDQGGKETRLATTAAFREFEQAMTAYRSTAIRILVNETGMTYSAVAELIGVSRQMVARLYGMGDAGKDGD